MSDSTAQLSYDPTTSYLEPSGLVCEDERTSVTPETLKRAYEAHLYYSQGKTSAIATLRDHYMALAYMVRDRLLQRWLASLSTYQQQHVKVVCYLSAEFLMGRHLENCLINLHLHDRVQQVLDELGLDFEQLLEKEEEPGLGNGGLGRLAACFLDSMATLDIPAVGYGIRYEFGIFHQELHNGWQIEIPDNWLRFGNPWELERREQAVEIKLGGHTEAYHDARGRYCVSWIPDRVIRAIPYDTPVPGYDTNNVSMLRLWKAEGTTELNLEAFNSGNYDDAVADKMSSETISKVLYPNDNTPQGRELRLEQQYFFVSASLQDIIRRHLMNHGHLERLHEAIAVQLNDTHPSVAVPELMRLLIDEHHLTWDNAWTITQRTFAYTNHTLLPEALERWPVGMFQRTLPRLMEIIYEINWRFLANVRAWYPGDDTRARRLSLIEEGAEPQVRMAHLACVGSHAINGVAALHTQLLKQETLRDFYELWPEKFFNMTNGVTPRRWLLQSNPRLANLISDRIGNDWIHDLRQLRRLEDSVNDREFLQRWAEVKHQNKVDLSRYIYQQTRIEVDPHSLFDVQVKRIHEYKRQLLAVMHIVTLYNWLKHNPQLNLVPRTFIFAGKAAPGYYRAKQIVKLINAVGSIINHDPDVQGRLKVVFLPNFNVSLGQRIYPAADLSEQISTAGKEASGTGNMKFTMNGALTIGTYDGANIEIREEVGPENFFLFGLRAEDIARRQSRGYRPVEFWSSNAELRAVLDRFSSGHFTPDQPNLFQDLVSDLLQRDEYMLMADYQSYIDCQREAAAAYRDSDRWWRMSLLNTARSGKFSSDRTIADYSEQIWEVKPVPVSLSTSF
ncbi:glycogen/starch/alpha-glucan phosphorylase [Synechococcus elongatus]|uniref:Alpha-1,4 glucan phosphorylase n=2 Tax=Synechococcus elongatus TaxID=32046 RepID=Q31RP3_SYNE7|nr:glycogen/starch/alpha-glucan phosphorylase [Synechococcus elongatus]ABB56276.1 Glycogen/starch/alpha-glucan phosphorylase [Synechococcus elongatus PCC 7942 = FACHB-805]AJD56675.1 maltodextrin phosphorylase [Synechococcus elongatus UTEX 2973]MBD2588108.1 glycogen/starch/alpha-glucan phosphorylase [Synechococcus elongatus FACHB-242]MBD2689176.1 glycogen/starch/alpha-glucan phosphorylase [Synechococcus elongatus FACHB-1061]MBD2707184.1 glycogen/starch/alpha-glucan phosphorylase [Synechococcus 